MCVRARVCLCVSARLLWRFAVDVPPLTGVQTPLSPSPPTLRSSLTKSRLPLTTRFRTVSFPVPPAGRGPLTTPTTHVQRSDPRVTTTTRGDLPVMTIIQRGRALGSLAFRLGPSTPQLLCTEAPHQITQRITRLATHQKNNRLRRIPAPRPVTRHNGVYYPDIWIHNISREANGNIDGNRIREETAICSWESRCLLGSDSIKILSSGELFFS